LPRLQLLVNICSLFSFSRGLQQLRKNDSSSRERERERERREREREEREDDHTGERG
jgi:hypothetical protein